MGNIISTLLWNNPKDLSLEEAYAILNETKASEPEQTIIETNETLKEYDTCIKIGTITEKKGKTFVIDNIHNFKSNNPILEVGSKISYKIFLTKSEVKIIDVKLIDNDWDVAESKKSSWCSRTLVGKVDGRQGREIIVNPGNITIDLNKIFTEFIPILGDWIELDVKCEIDENITDLSGGILEINKITPLRVHVLHGVISKYDVKTNTGIINKKIFFNNNSFPFGYMPCVSDKVVVEVFESDQKMCTWRALRIFPDERMVTNLKLSLPQNKDHLMYHEYINIQSERLNFNKLHETTCFFILIENTSNQPHIIDSVKFMENNAQCKVLTPVVKHILNPKDVHKILCECISKCIGNSQEMFSIQFEGFNMGHWISIFVSLNHVKEDNYVKTYSRLKHQEEENVVRGQKSIEAPRFIKFRVPDYVVPKKLLNVYVKYQQNEYVAIKTELTGLKSALFTDLSIMNYEDKFHTLLHLEEISILLAVQRYDQVACFVRNGEYLMLEIKNLYERRPSLLIGDKILAIDLTDSTRVYEGFIHKVGQNHVFLKFSPLFHDAYDGQDYSLTVRCGRGMFNRWHHAVFLAARYLGKELLFPSQVIEKAPQVKLREREQTPQKKLTPQQVMKKMVDYKNMTATEKENYKNSRISAGYTIEWYNETLNVYQKDAVRNILMGIARPLPYIIFGPPGTGKTVTIIETILQILRLMPQSRMLVSAPSNSAVDLIALRLINTGILKPGDLIRVISHNYLLSQLLPLKLVPYSATMSIARDGTGPDEETTEDGLKLGCSSSTIGRHRITITTCGTAGRMFSLGFKRDHFTHILVDEAAQANEPEVMIPLSFLNKFSGQLILAGDPIQLGPVILNVFANEGGLGESYIERVLSRFPYLRDIDGFPDSAGYDPRLVTKLRYNYRSLESLLKLTSSLFYNNDLIPTISNEDSEEIKILQSLKDILPTKSNTGDITNIIFHGVKGDNCRSEDSPSWYNPHEISQVFYYVNELYRMGLSSEDIGIITPYVKQVKEIKKILNEAEFDVPKIGTVEEFQGQEYKVVILSIVRSCMSEASTCMQQDLYFISCPRRLNVAISRAKILLIIIGNPAFLIKHVTWRSIIKYVMENGVYKGCEF